MHVMCYCYRASRRAHHPSSEPFLINNIITYTQSGSRQLRGPVTLDQVKNRSENKLNFSENKSKCTYLWTVYYAVRL